MNEQEKFSTNPDTRTDTLDRLLRYAMQKSGVKSTQIESAETRWGTIVERFQEMQAMPRAANPEAVPALIYAEFKANATRLDANVIAMTALVLDIDKDADIDRARTALAGLEAVIYSTKRSTLTAPRLRVILPLAAPISARDWPGTYRHFSLSLGLQGLDPCAEKLSQPFLAPPGGGYFEHLRGDWLDPTPYIGSARKAEYDALPQPEPIDQQLPAVPALDLNLIPAPMRDWIADVAYRMQCPVDYCAVGALVALAGVVGASVGIRPKRRDDWLVIPNLWGGVIGPPSKKKTPALADMLKALGRLEVAAKDGSQKAKAASNDPETKIKQKLLKKELEAAIKAEREEARAAATADAYIEATAKKEARPRQSRLSEPRAAAAIKLELATLTTPPVGPLQARFRTNDATIEALHDLLSMNPRGILVFRDELVGLLKAWEKQGHEQDRAFYLEAWNGHGSFPLDRIGRGQVICDNMCVSILGGTQPDKVRGYLYQAREENDGLLQRFQLLVYPDATAYSGLVDEYPDTAARDTAFSIYDTLARAEFAQLAESDEYGKIPYLRFTDPAQEVFNTWYDDLHMNQIEAPDSSPLLVEYLSKQPKTFAALALLLHLIERANAIQQGEKPGRISEAAARRAQGWCAYLTAHARRVYSLGQTLQSQAAGELARRIQAGAVEGYESFTARDIYRKQWSLLNDTEIVAEALNELSEAGWLLRDVHGSGYQMRGHVRYRINPKVKRKT